MSCRPPPDGRHGGRCNGSVLFSGAELLDGLIVSHLPRAVKAYLQIGHQARGITFWESFPRVESSGDELGRQIFLQDLGSGTTIEQVKAIMLGSPEYFQRAGSTNLAFLQALYHSVLNRALDPAGQAGLERRPGARRPRHGRIPAPGAPKPSKT
jgi:hypothetical protein